MTLSNRRYGACAGDVATPCCWLKRYAVEFTETHYRTLLGAPRHANQPKVERLQIMPEVDFIFTATASFCWTHRTILHAKF